MFEDINVAQNFALGKNQMQFCNLPRMNFLSVWPTLNNLERSSLVCIIIEAYNRLLKKSQMEVQVWFWDKERN